MEQDQTVDVFSFLDSDSFSPGSSRRFVRMVAFSTLIYNAPHSTFRYKLGKAHCLLFHGCLAYIPGVKETLYSAEDGLKISFDSVDMTQKKTPEGFWLLLVIPYDNLSRPVQFFEDELVGLLSLYFGQNYAYQRVFCNDFNMDDRTLQMEGPHLEHPDHSRKLDVNSETVGEYSNLLNKLESAEQKVQDKILSALRWFVKSSGKFGVEGFVFLWTALEIVGKDSTQKASILKAKMVTLYNVEENDLENRYYIGHLESFRGKIIHAGFDMPIDGSILEYVKCLVEDMVIFELTGERASRLTRLMKNDRKRIIKAIESY